MHVFRQYSSKDTNHPASTLACERLTRFLRRGVQTLILPTNFINSVLLHRVVVLQRALPLAQNHVRVLAPLTSNGPSDVQLAFAAKNTQNTWNNDTVKSSITHPICRLPKRTAVSRTMTTLDILLFTCHLARSSSPRPHLTQYTLALHGQLVLWLFDFRRLIPLADDRYATWCAQRKTQQAIGKQQDYATSDSRFRFRSRKRRHNTPFRPFTSANTIQHNDKRNTDTR